MVLTPLSLGLLATLVFLEQLGRLDHLVRAALQARLVRQESDLRVLLVLQDRVARLERLVIPEPPESADLQDQAPPEPRGQAEPLDLLDRLESARQEPQALLEWAPPESPELPGQLDPQV